MNRDQIKGSGKEIAGKVQKNLGRATGSAKNELKGAAKEATGKVQKAFGDARKKTG
jgi:uncharacterized protein YjbJ (UPF0337 family)